MKHNSEGKFPVSSSRKNTVRIAALIFWLTVFAGYQIFAIRNDLSPAQVVQSLLQFMVGSFWGPLVYILVYSIRPLVLFPSTLLTLAGGFLFGPVMGVIYTVLASNISATIAFFIGRYFGEGLIKNDSTSSLIQKYARRMQDSSFETVIVMRFIFLPYDLVNYLAGFLGIRWLPFILASILGSIPGTISFVLAGASVEYFDGGIPRLNPTTFAISILIFVSSLLLSNVFRKKERIPS